MTTKFEDLLKLVPTITTEKLVKECEKILGVLGRDQLVNLSLEDRMNLTKNFEYDSYDSIGILTLQALVPNYAIKKGSLLLKERENFILTSKQCQHAQKLYDEISHAVNSYPYGTITCYDFEPWTIGDPELRLTIMLEYDKYFEGGNIV
ncbi:TPA: hypothetical protein U2C09_001498 [Streptococcus suis]|nr:hypothetical protein [Streptococcus suis]